MIGAVIVTFNPEIDRIRENINAIVNQVSCVLIVDNASKNVADIMELIDGIDSVKLITLKDNLGIAAAQNTGMTFLEKKGYSWAVTLDQDSIVDNELVTKLTSKDEFQDKSTAILAARYVDDNWDQRTLAFHDNLSGSSVVDKVNVISSGNLVRIAAWRQVGGFDEQLFIDSVDTDFNRRLIYKGWRVLQVNDVEFRHTIGTVINKPVLKKMLLFNDRETFTDHSATRQYYIFRNQIIMLKRYYNFPNLRIIHRIWRMRHLILLPNSYIKFKSACRGVFDGMKYNVKKDQFFQNFLQKD